MASTTKAASSTVTAICPTGGQTKIEPHSKHAPACLLEQFSKFSPVDGMTINGELTLGENIGDLSGVGDGVSRVHPQPGRQRSADHRWFTGPQRFFIGYAMSRKGKYTNEALISRISRDPHSPLEFRVNGPYPNIDAFHEAFGTQEGDGMWLAPEDRVRIW